MKKKKGFTLIELLAVIVILAVIALIATPIILNIIEKARKSAFQDSAYGLIETARLQYAEGLLNGSGGTVEYDFDGATGSNLKFSGSRPNGGKVIVDSNGKVGVAVHNGKWCAKKEINEASIAMIEYSVETCKIATPPKTFDDIMNASTEVMTNDPDENKRFVGKNPNNYVKFNNELWRVIGVFDGQAKIISRDFLYSTGKEWDIGGINNWVNASLQTELNGTYLNGIEATSKSYIDTTHVWNLGGGPQNNVPEWTRTKMYNYERGTAVYSGRPTTWTGAIGLMYLSDFGYATSHIGDECNLSMYDWDKNENAMNCMNNSWLYDNAVYQWVLSTCNDDATQVFSSTISGSVNHYAANGTGAGLRPALFLKSEVKIASGTGTETDPFILTM